MEYVWNVYEERASQLEGEEDTVPTPLPRFHYDYLISRTEIYKHGSAVLEAPPEEIPMNPFQLLLLDINKEIRKVQRRETPDDVVFRGGFAAIEVDQGETITEDEGSRICSIINTNIPSTWCTEEQLMVEAACCKVFTDYGLLYTQPMWYFDRDSPALVAPDLFRHLPHTHDMPLP